MRSWLGCIVLTIYVFFFFNRLLRCYDALVERYTEKFLPIQPTFRALNPVYFQFCYCLMKVNTFDEVDLSTKPANATNVTKRVNFFNLTQSNVDNSKEPGRNCNNRLLVVQLVVFFMVSEGPSFL